MKRNTFKALPEIPDELKAPGRLKGYHHWCEKVDNWANKHGITRKQAVSVLFFDNLPDKHGNYDNRAKELYWNDCSDFASITLNK